MLVFIRDSENCELPEDKEKIILVSNKALCVLC